MQKNSVSADLTTGEGYALVILIFFTRVELNSVNRYVCSLENNWRELYTFVKHLCGIIEVHLTCDSILLISFSSSSRLEFVILKLHFL